MNTNNKSLSILIYGNNGEGKSTLANTLTCTKKFLENDGFDSKTKTPEQFDGIFEGLKTSVIDTPGFGSSEGRLFFEKYLKDIIECTVDKENSIPIFIFLANYYNFVLGNAAKMFFDIISSLYSDQEWFNHVVIIFPHCKSYIPEVEVNEKLNSYSKNFQSWFSENIHSDISEDEIKQIPIIAIDSKEARNTRSKSNQILYELLKRFSTKLSLVNDSVKISQNKLENANQISHSKEEVGLEIVSMEDFERNNNNFDEMKNSEISDYEHEHFEDITYEKIQKTNVESDDGYRLIDIDIRHRIEKVGSIKTPIHEEQNWSDKIFYQKKILYAVSDEKMLIVEKRRVYSDSFGKIKYSEWIETLRTTYYEFSGPCEKIVEN